MALFSVGVNDAGEYIGTEADQFASDDKMLLHLDNLIKDRLGGAVFASIMPEFVEISGKRVIVIKCAASTKAVFLKTAAGEEFFIRASASSQALSAS